MQGKRRERRAQVGVTLLQQHKGRIHFIRAAADGIRTDVIIHHRLFHAVDCEPMQYAVDPFEILIPGHFREKLLRFQHFTPGQNGLGANTEQIVFCRNEPFADPLRVKRRAAVGVKALHLAYHDVRMFFLHHPHLLFQLVGVPNIITVVERNVFASCKGRTIVACRTRTRILLINIS